VDGFSIDFVTLNTIAFCCYTIYTINFLWNDNIREQYRLRHEGRDNSVAPNDFALALHAFILSTIMLGQTYYYPRAKGQGLSRYNKAVVIAFFMFAVVDSCLLVAGHLPGIDFLYRLSYFKLYTSYFKFIPQAYVNFSRRSTAGFSIKGVLLDLAGGLLSLLQSLIIAAAEDNWSSVMGNPVKLGLSIASLLFPTIFITQHYILYPEPSEEGKAEEERAEERTALLA